MMTTLLTIVQLQDWFSLRSITAVFDDLEALSLLQDLTGFPAFLPHPQGREGQEIVALYLIFQSVQCWCLEDWLVSKD